jgi:nitrogen regulatory protein PII-like uncharacterized protein
MTIEELFGTLQQAMVGTWRKHLRTAKYGKHVALNDFYEELPDLVDALIEGYMGATGRKINGFTNIIQSKNMNTLMYLQELKRICKQGYDLLDDNEELESHLDDIVNLINSTLYKVKELNENEIMDLADFIKEALNESAGAALDQRSVERFFGDKYGRDRNLKTAISKSLRVLKSFTSDFTSEQYNMLEQLIDNPENEFDYRSKATMYNQNGKYGEFRFVLTSNNFPNAIINKLDDVTVNKIFKNIGKGYRTSLNGFGATQTLLIGIEWDSEESKWLNLEDAIKLVKHVLDTIAPIFKDILSWREEGKEKDAFARRGRIRESVNESVNDAKNLIKDMYNEDGDLVSVASCYHWLDSLDWEQMSEDEYAQEITYINDDIDFTLAKLRYTAVMVAMADIGKDKTLKIIKSIVNRKSELKEYDIE